jgi:hypothetical protein
LSAAKSYDHKIVLNESGRDEVEDFAICKYNST